MEAAASAPAAAVAPEAPAPRVSNAGATRGEAIIEAVAQPEAAPPPEPAPAPAVTAEEQPEAAPAVAEAVTPAGPPATPTPEAAQPPPGPPQPSRPPPPPPNGRRVAVITGGTRGIGFATAAKLLRRNDFDGAHPRGYVARHALTRDPFCAVIIAVRETSGPAVADEAVAALKASVPFLDEQDAPRLLALPLDLTRPTSVEDFASRVMSITPSVHWLFLNAAVGDVASSVWGSKPVLTAEGHEQTVATNYFGHYLLCHHLLKALTFAAPSRIVSVSCGRHKHAWLLDHTNWQSLNPAPWWHPVHFKAGDAYNNSKVMNILFAFKLSRTYAVANGVSANAVDPGIVPGTGLLRDQSPFYRTAYEHITAPTWSVAMRVVTPEQAADALIAAAEHPKGSTYFEGPRADGAPAAQTRDEILQSCLWADTATLLGVEWPVPGTDL